MLFIWHPLFVFYMNQNMEENSTLIIILIKLKTSIYCIHNCCIKEYFMKLIADSGSTSTHWMLIYPNDEQKEIFTKGINPFLQTDIEIYDLIKTEFNHSINDKIQIFFYGAGCANIEKNSIVERALLKYFPNAKVLVDSDMMGACRALLKDSKGIVSILGTGSNSCFYNGSMIEKNVSPLGYILGDEGSGAYLGRKLLSDILKNQLSREIQALFFNKYNTTQAEIQENVYKKPFPNRYMAGFTRFLSENITYTEIENIVKSGFAEFIKRNILQYEDSHNYPLSFVGSVAYIFENQLKEVAENLGYTIGKIVQNPMDDLVDYHLK